MERRDYLNPAELAGLWNLETRHVYELIKEMREAGKWSDSIIRPLKTPLVTADAFEEFLKWRDGEKWRKAHESK